jgi:hypothetical protein
MAAAQQQSQSEIQLVEGHIQQCSGFLERQSKHLKRWKKEYIEIVVGELMYDITLWTMDYSLW